MIVFASIFDINSHLNLSTHLQDKFASIPTTALDTSEIVTQLKLIASAVASPCWWSVYLNFIGILISAAISGFILWRVTITIPEKRKKEDQRSIVLSALSSLESTRLNLQNFKDVHLSIQAKNATRLAKYILSPQKISEHTQSFMDKKNIFQQDFGIICSNILEEPEFSEYKSNGPAPNTFFLDPNKVKLDPIQIFSGLTNWNFWVKDSPKLIDIYYRLILNNPMLFPNTPFKQHLSLIFHSETLAKNLQFISLYNRGFLVILDKAFEGLRQVNSQIDIWNKTIEKAYFIKSPDLIKKHQFVKDYIELAYNLYDLHISLALEYNFLATIALQEYLEKNDSEFYSENTLTCEVYCKQDIDRRTAALSSDCHSFWFEYVKITQIKSNKKRRLVFNHSRWKKFKKHFTKKPTT